MGVMLKMTDRQKVENLLLKIESYKMDIAELEMEIEIQQSEGSLMGISYDNISTSKTNSVSSAVERSFSRIESMKHKKKYYEIMIKRIENGLNLLNESDKELIDLYYFQNMTLIDISFKLDFNDNYLSRRKAKILDRLAVFYKKHGLIN